MGLGTFYLNLVIFSCTFHCLKIKTLLFYVNFIMRGLTPIVFGRLLRIPVQYIGTLRRQIYILFPFPRVLVIFINQYCTKYKGGGETLSWRWLYEGFGSPPAAKLSIKKQSSFIQCHCSPVAFAIVFYYRTHGQLCGSHGQSIIFTGRKKEPGQDAIWYMNPAGGINWYIVRGCSCVDIKTKVFVVPAQLDGMGSSSSS